MNNFSPFNSAPIRKLKLLKLGKFRISLSIMAAIAMIVLLFVLSTIKIDDAEATFVRGGDFKIGMAISGYSFFEGDNMNVTIFLTNMSSQNQFVVFQGACQATYQIYDMDGKLVYPNSAENTPCNNASYEEFLMAPQQVKRYFFSLVNKAEVQPILLAGKYKIVGKVEGFGDTDTKVIEVLERPKTTNAEGELCQGLTGRACDKGLECRFEGGFPGGAGMCFKVEDDYKPTNNCISGTNRCFNDVNDHPNKDVIEKFVLLDRISGFDNGDFKPDEPIGRQYFYDLTSKISGVPINLSNQEAFIKRDEAVAILYNSFIRNEKPQTLEESPFIDTNDSKFKSYLTASYNLGALFLNEDKLFYPHNNLTRVQALVLIDRFEGIR